MTISDQLVQPGPNREFQFRDRFVMPLLVRLGFGVVVNYHGQREFGRDVIFGDVDRFGHVVYYGMQVKYEPSIGLADSNQLAEDATQATNNSFKHPHTGREAYISCFYVANAGDISDQARDNFFSTIARRGIRDARLLDGNALVLLDKAAALNRNANIQERLTGLLQEVRRNRSSMNYVLQLLQSLATDPKTPIPMQRCRTTATGNYLNAPFAIPGLSIDVVDQYWEACRMFNDVADSLHVPLGLTADYLKIRIQVITHDIAPRSSTRADQIENALVVLLGQLSAARAL